MEPEKIEAAVQAILDILSNSDDGSLPISAAVFSRIVSTRAAELSEAKRAEFGSSVMEMLAGNIEMELAILMGGDPEESLEDMKRAASIAVAKQA